MRSDFPYMRRSAPKSWIETQIARGKQLWFHKGCRRNFVYNLQLLSY